MVTGAERSAEAALRLRGRGAMETTPRSDAGRAHDMSRFWRIFSYQHGRINGTFVVHGSKGGVHHVKPYEVTVFADDSHPWGRVLRSDDMTAFYRGGAVDIPMHMIQEAVRPDVEGALGELITAIAECIAAYESSEQESVDV